MYSWCAAGGRMKQWEYISKTKSYTDDELNRMGLDGWEMCGVYYSDKTDIEVFFFKRLII